MRNSDDFFFRLNEALGMPPEQSAKMSHFFEDVARKMDEVKRALGDRPERMQRKAELLRDLKREFRAEMEDQRRESRENGAP